MIVFLLQSYLSLSSLSTSCCKYRDIICSFELDWDKLRYTFPNVSHATNKLTRGAIWNAGTELLLPGAYHFIRLKSDIPSHVSSKFKYTRSGRSFLMKFKAQVCLKILLVCEFAELAICLTLRYLNPYSLITFLISLIVMRFYFGLREMHRPITSSDCWIKDS